MWSGKSRIWLVAVLGVSFVTTVSWMIWTENAPDDEKRLRQEVHRFLETAFPEQMVAPVGSIGWRQRLEGRPDARLGVVLIHGLDEPGDIWDDLVAAVAEDGWPVWEFLYPNDQSIEWSADLLAQEWIDRVEIEGLVLIGHSMGGLVVRDFVTRQEPGLGGPAVTGAILVGTPNQGSDWARFRVWLEIRDALGHADQREFSFFSALRDGTGAAKVDLRPRSRFLQDLNSRAWPSEIPLHLIAGQILPGHPSFQAQMERFKRAFSDPRLQALWQDWWTIHRDLLGDGVVTVESASIPGQKPPLVIAASHRGLLRRSVLEPELPPAIPYLREWIQSMAGSSIPPAGEN